MEPSRFKFLLAQFKLKQLSLSENKELLDFVGGCDENKWYKEFEGMIENDENNIGLPQEFLTSQLKEVLAIDKQPKIPTTIPSAHRVHFLKTAWFRYAAAILLILGTAGYIFISKQNIIEKPIVVQEINKEPGQNKAILILSNGKEIILDNSNSENIADGSISIQKNNGVLTYNGLLTSAAEASAKAAFNTMNTPRGGQYQLVLPDGSKVWLNAASSLKYPTVFQGENRIVELSGEAYFTITKDPKKPFRVKVNNADIEVLGTSFNINAYPDESGIQTTLVEGKVKVSLDNKAVQLVPGEQANINISNNNLTTEKNVDIDQVVSWQQGLFQFRKADIGLIGRQISRWYDIDVRVDDNIKELKLGGAISKKVSLNKLLELLGKQGVDHKWEKDKLILNKQ